MSYKKNSGFSKKQTKTVPKNSYLFRQDEPTFGFFTIEKGAIRLIRHNNDGSEVCLHRAKAGDTIAEASLFSDLYHCNALADEETKVIVHSKNNALKQLQCDSSLALTFMAHLSHQVIELRMMIELRNIRNAEERLLTFLQLKCDPRTLEYQIDEPIKKIAVDIGLTHEVIYRCLSKLKKNKKITRTDTVITIISK